jgi:hypothetical protein
MTLLNRPSGSGPNRSPAHIKAKVDPSKTQDAPDAAIRGFLENGPRLKLAITINSDRSSVHK